MKMKTVINFKDGTVYRDRDFNKGKVIELTEKLGRFLDNDLIESIFVTKYIYTKEIKEKYFDAFEEAIESIRTFYSDENCENVTKEAENFFGAEMLKIKLKEEEEERMRERRWLGGKIDRLDYALVEKEKELSAKTEELSNLKSELEEAAREKATYLDVINKLKAEIENSYNDLLEQRETIDELNDSLDDEERLLLIIEEQDSKLKEFTNKIGELLNEKDFIKSKFIEMIRAYDQKHKEKEENLIETIEELNERYKNMENEYISKIAREQLLSKYNWNALLSELNSLKKRNLWQRIRNKH